jgi:ubiquinone/menaquinone biosynthesis C-methylase UbiE
MEKINQHYIIQQYQSGVKSYSEYTKEVGLWASEQYVFQKYLQKSDKILDIGCGTGRTTFPLYLLGYQNIIGIDLTPEMIAEAQKLNKHFNTDIVFEVGDARQLQFEDAEFDIVIFSFNGLMSIPCFGDRNLAVQNIHRVLKVDGTFIFTTHDRDKEPQFLSFWKEEEERWNMRQQNPALFEFGDLITSSKNEEREIFIHIPDMAEVRRLLENNGFEVTETFYRSDKFKETEKVLEKSGECRFWVAKKH